MRKRETLIESKRYVSKFDFYIEKETFIQTVDSHIEALDEIERLKQEYVFVQDNWYREEDRANLLSLENDRLRQRLEDIEVELDMRRRRQHEDPTDPARPNDTC